jgi:hypothetical protein
MELVGTQGLSSLCAFQFYAPSELHHQHTTSRKEQHMIVEGQIKCDWSYSGPCDNKITVLIITEFYLENDEPIEGTIFVCDEHAPEMMHEQKSSMSPEEPIWTIDLDPKDFADVGVIKKVQ